jgi:DNA-directed RNA polymerase specialized sigma24 family protein
MQPGPEAQPRGAAGFGIEPDQASGAGNSSSVPAEWLAEFNDSQEQRDLDQALAALRRRQERLAQDVDLITWLALQGFTGRDYEVFATELAKYGNAVIIAWIRRGVIFARVRDRGFGGLPEPPLGALNQPDVAEELAGETVAKALYFFREKVLLGKRWNPAKGASIKTFFVGQCLIQFANVYRRWLNNEAITGEVLIDDLTLVDRPPTQTTDPAELAAIRAEIDARLKDVPERTRAVMVLTAADWPQTEIAARLGITVKAVERTLEYYRTTNRRKGAA